MTQNQNHQSRMVGHVEVVPIGRAGGNSTAASIGCECSCEAEDSSIGKGGGYLVASVIYCADINAIETVST